MFLMHNPSTGDPGMSPVVFILFVVCAILIVGCLVWAFFLNRKNSKINQTVITVTEDDEEIEPTVVEEIDAITFDGEININDNDQEDLDNQQ